jgi:hypothetical protein
VIDIDHATVPDMEEVDGHVFQHTPIVVARHTILKWAE